MTLTWTRNRKTSQAVPAPGTYISTQIVKSVSETRVSHPLTPREGQNHSLNSTAAAAADSAICLSPIQMSRCSTHKLSTSPALVSPTVRITSSASVVSGPQTPTEDDLKVNRSSSHRPSSTSIWFEIRRRLFRRLDLLRCFLRLTTTIAASRQDGELEAAVVPGSCLPWCQEELFRPPQLRRKRPGVRGIEPPAQSHIEWGWRMRRLSPDPVSLGGFSINRSPGFPLGQQLVYVRQLVFHELALRLHCALIWMYALVIAAPPPNAFKLFAARLLGHGSSSDSRSTCATSDSLGQQTQAASSPVDSPPSPFSPAASELVSSSAGTNSILNKRSEPAGCCIRTTMVQTCMPRPRVSAADSNSRSPRVRSHPYARPSGFFHDLSPVQSPLSAASNRPHLSHSVTSTPPATMKETGAMTEAGEITSEVISPYRAFKTSHNSYIAEPRNFSSNFKPEVYGLPRVSSTSAPPILPAVYGDPATTTTAAAATTVATAVASLASLRVAFALCDSDGRHLVQLNDDGKTSCKTTGTSPFPYCGDHCSELFSYTVVSTAAGSDSSVLPEGGPFARHSLHPRHHESKLRSSVTDSAPLLSTSVPLAAAGAPINRDSSLSGDNHPGGGLKRADAPLREDMSGSGSQKDCGEHPATSLGDYRLLRSLPGLVAHPRLRSYSTSCSLRSPRHAFRRDGRAATLVCDPMHIKRVTCNVLCEQAEGDPFAPDNSAFILSNDQQRQFLQSVNGVKLALLKLRRILKEVIHYLIPRIKVWAETYLGGFQRPLNSRHRLCCAKKNYRYHTSISCNDILCNPVHTCSFCM
ncbi:unnamed protein product [Schistocephalus solidus]|uniref:Uncharacterized protein n=1 Tax=Schistocephalus solidus TaxID=70667 RepID=A0A183T668_SCHSO|nr:unnamed protein product [Schistocephalus solidus]